MGTRFGQQKEDAKVVLWVMGGGLISAAMVGSPQSVRVCGLLLEESERYLQARVAYGCHFPTLVPLEAIHEHAGPVIGHVACKEDGERILKETLSVDGVTTVCLAHGTHIEWTASGWTFGQTKVAWVSCCVFEQTSFVTLFRKGKCEPLTLVAELNKNLSEATAQSELRGRMPSKATTKSSGAMFDLKLKEKVDAALQELGGCDASTVVFCDANKKKLTVSQTPPKMSSHSILVARLPGKDARILDANALTKMLGYHSEKVNLCFVPKGKRQALIAKSLPAAVTSAMMMCVV